MGTYLGGNSAEIQGLLDALGVSASGVTRLQLTVEPEQLVRLELERLVTTEEVAELTKWVLKMGVKAEQLAE